MGVLWFRVSVPNRFAQVWVLCSLFFVFWNLELESLFLVLFPFSLALFPFSFCLSLHSFAPSLTVSDGEKAGISGCCGDYSPVFSQSRKVSGAAASKVCFSVWVLII